MKVLSSLQSLGIRHKETHKNEIQIICPSHNDRNLGTACTINSETGQWGCRSCGETGNLITLTALYLRVSTKEAFKKLREGGLVEAGRRSQGFREWRDARKKERKENKDPVFKSASYLKTIPFVCKENKYASARYWSQDYIDGFNVRICNQGYFEGYLIIPIADNEHQVDAYEARKVMEPYRLSEFLQRDVPGAGEGLKKARKDFEDWAKDSGTKLVKIDGKTTLMCRGRISDNEILRYLLLPKVLYPAGTFLDKPTIWNYQGLDLTKPLAISEGWGSVPRMWRALTDNVSCTFGSVVSEKQLTILSQFPTIILLKDRGAAGDAMLRTLASGLTTELLLVDTDLSDEDEELESQLGNWVTPLEFLRKRGRLHEFGFRRGL